MVLATCFIIYRPHYIGPIYVVLYYELLKQMYYLSQFQSFEQHCSAVKLYQYFHRTVIGRECTYTLNESVMLNNIALLYSFQGLERNLHETVCTKIQVK